MSGAEKEADLESSSQDSEPLPLSLSDLDNELAAVDPDFLQSLETISKDDDLLRQPDLRVRLGDTDLPIEIPRIKIVYLWLRNLFVPLGIFIVTCVAKAFTFLQANTWFLIKNLPSWMWQLIKLVFKTLLQLYRKLSDRWQRISTQSKILLGFLSALIVGSIQYGSWILTGDFVNLIFRPPLYSLDSVADHAYSLSVEEARERIDETLFQPNYIVLLDKVVANIKGEPGTNPMLVVEFYLQTTGRNAAIEIRRRQRELIDVIQQDLESKSYAFLLTPQGKNRMKSDIKKKLNPYINEGRIKQVFIRTLIFKP